MTRPVLTISREQFRVNLEAVMRRLEPSRLMIVMKDDAYGHGAGWAAEDALRSGVHWFGSYDVATGVDLRRRLEGAPRIFAWATSDDDEVADALLHDLDLGVGSEAYLERVIAQAGALGRRARVHLKIDTGLHRNGIRPEDWDRVVARTRAAEDAGTLHLVGVWSHLSEASDEADDESHAVFTAACDAVARTGDAPEITHLTASAASWWRPELRGTVSRIGAFCYGIRSAGGPDLDGVLPIATLSASVIALEDERVVIDAGSFDGIPSTLVGVDVGTPGGVRRLERIIETTSDVASWEGAAIGDEVRIFGPGSWGETDATSLAERIGTVGEEILTRLAPRVRRSVV
ncbi:MAG: alanine racemase [Actinomycetota bacterium]